jgi:hypothetical protein
MNEMLAESLRDQILTEAVGPLITVLLGGFVLGFITRQFQMRDSDQKLRESIALDVARVGGLFYSLAAEAMDAQAMKDPELIDIANKALQEQFRQFNLEAVILEKRLAAYSGSGYLAWHAASDCATVLYYILTGTPESRIERIVTINEKGYDGKDHSRLSREELRDQDKVMDQFAAQMSNINAETLKKSKNTIDRKGL